MNDTRMLKKMVTSAVLSGGLALAGFAVGTGVAHADGSHQWCPGNPQNMPYVPNNQLDWDWNTCHTWYSTNPGQGNVTIHGQPASIWDGANPPTDAVTPRQCPTDRFHVPVAA